MASNEVELADVVDADVIPDPASATLFGSDDPDVVLERMAKAAKSLDRLVREQGLVTKIRGRDHVQVAAWQAIASMLGAFPIVAWTQENSAGDGIVARAEVRTRRGELIGAAESECSRSESSWRSRDPYAIRSMAQTRAIGRALRATLGAIVVLAGYEPTGAEEMPGDVAETPADGSQALSAPPMCISEPARAVAEPPGAPEKPDERPEAVTAEQWGQIGALLEDLELRAPELDWRAQAEKLAGCPAAMLTTAGAAILISRLGKELASAKA